MSLETTNVWIGQSGHDIVPEMHQEGTYHVNARKTLLIKTSFRQYILGTKADLGIADTAFSLYSPFPSTLVNSC